MRILVLSDSHGDVDSMKQAVARTQPDQILHLGDCWRDAEALQKAFPQLGVAKVPGNCDAFDPCARGPRELLLTFAGHRLFLCHGDRYRVKRDLLALSYAAEEQGAEVAIFGHTHAPYLQRHGGVTLLNPGSIGAMLRHSFAVVEIEGEKLACALLTLEN